jgi:UDP-N-acetylmuramoyl-tripeptide--D-alanyl-D-alanine ligase
LSVVAHDAPIVVSAAMVAAATGGTVRGSAERPFVRFSIDSRTLEPGDVFIAIKGERFDGARFADAALERGAVGVIVARDAGLGSQLASRWPGAGIVEVDDATAALQALARHVRLESGAKVVAITGSAGKTTTKEAAAEFLAARYRVFRNAGNLNNHIGLPLSLLNLVTRPDVAVVELGMNHPGEISQLVGIAEPDVRVWINVGDAHLGFFKSEEEIADAKAEILERADSRSILVANADDPLIAPRIRRFPGRVVTFGRSPSATVRAADIDDRGIEGTAAALETPAGRASLVVPLVGTGNLLNVLAAAAVALELGVPLGDILDRAGQLRPAKHRGEVVRLAQGATLVDDSYNSSPAALKHALQALAQDRAHSRRVAVLGEMLELGAFSEALHAESGRAAAQSGVQVLITVGGAAAASMADAAREAGVNDVRHVRSSVEAAALAVQLVQAGDLVLVKGSRGIGTDAVVDRLKAERG